MIRAIFHRQGDILHAVEMTGHAGYAESGRDIVCASVTSALQLTCNGVTEVLGLPAVLEVEENLLRLTVPPPHRNAADAFLQALYLHLGLLSEEYPENLTLTVVEV